MSKGQYFEAGLHQIIEEKDGFDLITMGRGEGSGCYCYLNSLIKKFSDDLMPSYKWIVMDNEAGLEHISRRTSTHLDALVLVVTDNPLSLHSAQSITEIVVDVWVVRCNDERFLKIGDSLKGSVLFFEGIAQVVEGADKVRLQDNGLLESLDCLFSLSHVLIGQAKVVVVSGVARGKIDRFF